MSEPAWVLDASALLALMLVEPGADVVAAILPHACVGTLNLSEVIAKLAERGVPSADLRESLADLDLDVRPFNAADALAAGLLRPATRSAGLSLGDRACLALAQRLAATAVTTDSAWTRLDLPIAVRAVR